jgi:hypothetical protein
VIFVLLLALATRLRTSWNPAEWLAFAVLAAIGFYTVPIMVYAVGGVVVWLGISLLIAREIGVLLRRLLPSLLVAGILSCVLYAPVVAASGLDALVRNEFVVSLPWRTFANELPDSLVSVATAWHRDVPAPLAAVLAAGFVLAVALHRRVSRYVLPPAVAVLLWIAPVVLVQRVVPFERVWLFLVPLYLMTASAGIVLLLRPLARRVRSQELPAILLAVVLAGSLAGNAVATQNVYDSEDTSTFRDGDAVTAWLAERLTPGDKVLVAPPADAILEYHLSRRGLDAARLLYWGRPGETERFYAVVKEAPGNYPLEHLLADPRLGRSSLGDPRLVRRFGGASVYELRRAA